MPTFPVKTVHLRPRLMAFKLSNSGTPSIGIGAADFSSTVTDNGIGDTTLTFKQAFVRKPVVILSAATGGNTVSHVATTTTLQITTFDSSDTAADIDVFGFIFGYDSLEHSADRFKAHFDVKNTRLRPRLIALSVTDGSPPTAGIGSSEVSSISKASSAYTINFKTPFASAPVAIASSQSASDARQAQVTTAAVDSVIVQSTTASGSAVDDDFFVMILGWDSPYEMGNLRRTIRAHSLKPRIEAYQITYSGGTPSVAINSVDGTPTDNGVGDTTITFTTAFARAPIAVACNGEGNTGASTDIHSTSTTIARVRAFDSSGTAADQTTDVLVLGYDNATEY